MCVLNQKFNYQSISKNLMKCEYKTEHKKYSLALIKIHIASYYMSNILFCSIKKIKMNIQLLSLKSLIHCIIKEGNGSSSSCYKGLGSKGTRFWVPILIPIIYVTFLLLLGCLKKYNSKQQNVKNGKYYYVLCCFSSRVWSTYSLADNQL